MQMCLMQMFKCFVFKAMLCLAPLSLLEAFQDGRGLDATIEKFWRNDVSAEDFKAERNAFLVKKNQDQT